MSLDRQYIEKKDFPIGRRGYEPDAVDAHLRAVADEADELRRASRQRTETLASTAADQVRAIVQAAEASAAEISRAAEEEARAIRSEARAEADRARTETVEQAREQVSRVAEATATMLGRVDAMEGELSSLVENLRTGTNRLAADLALLQGNMDEVRGAVPTAGPARDGLDGADAGGSVGGREPQPLEAAGPNGPARVAEPEPVGAGLRGGGDASEGARLIALNMALNGTPRDEADRYLAENFELDDRGGLLDEVYARVGE